jgi:hypothetical protein
MAGLGRKVWSAGDVLAAAEVNGYLMDQAVMVFADEAARTAAIGTPSQGMLAYLQDTSKVTVYGTAWADLVPADVVSTLTSSTATAYTVASADAGNFLRFTAGATVTVGTATAFTAGQQVQILADGTALSIAGGTGVTLGGAGTAGTALTFAVGGQYEAVSVFCVDTDTYRVIGNVSEAV